MDAAAATDDADLLRAARGGDRRALEALLARHQGRVYRFSMRMCRNPADADDVLQETLLALARSVRDLRDGAALSTWLYSVARSHCIKARRQGKYAPKQLEPLSTAAVELGDRGPRPDDAAAAREVESALAQALASLSDEHREVVLLRDGEGLTAPEVAAVLGIGVEAVKSRLHRARLALRAALLPLLGEDTGRARAAGCPDVLGNYSRLLEGEIDAATCRDMERHLSGCQPCGQLCDSLKRTLALCSTSAAPEIPAAVRDALRAELGRLIAAQP